MEGFPVHFFTPLNGLLTIRKGGGGKKKLVDNGGGGLIKSFSLQQFTPYVIRAGNRRALIMQDESIGPFLGGRFKPARFVVPFTL